MDELAKRWIDGIMDVLIECENPSQFASLVLSTIDAWCDTHGYDRDDYFEKMTEHRKIVHENLKGYAWIVEGGEISGL